MGCRPTVRRLRTTVADTAEALIDRHLGVETG
jgi:hypothetical protein